MAHSASVSLKLKGLANVKEQKMSWSHQLGLEELGNVEERREEDDRQDVARHPGHRARRGRVVSETYFFTFFSFKYLELVLQTVESSWVARSFNLFALYFQSLLLQIFIQDIWKEEVVTKK